MDENLDEEVEEGKVDLLNPIEEGAPGEATGFSMRAQKDMFLGGGQEKTGPALPLRRLSKDSKPDVQQRVNSFLNGASKGFEFDDGKFRFNLDRQDYYCYAFENDGSLQGAMDAELTDRGVMNIFRMRTDSDASRAYFQENGRTLGQDIFTTAIDELKQKGAKEVYAEVSEDGYRFLKRQAEQGMISLTVDEAPKEGAFGLIRGKIV